MPFVRFLGVLMQRLVNGLTHRSAAGIAPDRRQFRARARGGLPLATLATLRPLAAGSARRNFSLAPQAAARNPPQRPVRGDGLDGPWICETLQ